MKNNTTPTLLLRLTVLPAVLLFSALLAHGQGLGRISGIVTDSTGAAVPSATISATRNGTGETVTAISSADGSYVFPSLPALPVSRKPMFCCKLIRPSP